MRIALIILIGIHGVIHLFGFLKAFELVEFNAISQAISKTVGLLWLFTFLLFLLTVFFYSVNSNYWWLFGFVAVMASQILIFIYWSDAKFGTIANLIILFASIIAYSNFSFEKKLKTEREALLKESQLQNKKEVVSKKSLRDLPPLIQKWLTINGTVGKEAISNVYLSQELNLKLKAEQESWNSGQAEQYFSIQPPAFNWSINTKMNPFLGVVGRDRFSNGKGEMTIKLLSIIPVANAKGDPKIDQASLQRYLAETVWFPSAALSPYIKWESISDYSARATMEYKGTEGSGVFYFDKEGNFEKFVTMRYRGSEFKEPTEWTVIATKIEERNGIKIPIECQASWKLESGNWTWLKLKIKDIKYNVNTRQ